MKGSEANQDLLTFQLDEFCSDDARFFIRSLSFDGEEGLKLLIALNLTPPCHLGSFKTSVDCMANAVRWIMIDAAKSVDKSDAGHDE